MGMRDIKAVIFDFGGVISAFDINIFLRRIEPYSALRFDALRSDVYPEAARQARLYETGLLDSLEFYRRITTIAQLRMPVEQFTSAYCDIFSPIPSTLELIRALKPHYRLALLSNTSEWHFEYGIKPVEVFPLFETVTLSYEVGVMKPDRAIYEDALRKLGLPAASCAYIDDLPENVAAAAATGMAAVQYTTHGEVTAALRRYGVTW
jgi:putative hydrolase of the HAD superfamily